MMPEAVHACLLTPSAPAPGDPLDAHARRLAARDGHRVTVALTDARLGGDPLTDDGVRLVDVETAARGDRFDVAIATDWTSAAQLFGVPATRYAFLVRTLEHERMGTWQAERFAAALAYDLPVDFLVCGRWLVDRLGDLRPDARVLLTPDGVDKAVFAPAGGGGGAAGDGPLRVLVDDRHAADREGSAERRALAAMGRPAEAAFAEPGDDPAARAAKLAAADVVLHLPPADGVLGLPLEGLHAGVPAVVTAALDQPEVLAHGETGLVVDHDDTSAAAGALDRLAGDRDLLAALSAAGPAAVAAWPDPDAAAETLAGALRTIVDEPPPDAVRWPVRLMGDAIAGAAILRQELAIVGDELRRVQGDEAFRVAQRVKGRYERADGPLRPVADRLLARAKSRLLR
jgi:hypothetical protein